MATQSKFHTLSFILVLALSGLASGAQAEGDRDVLPHSDQFKSVPEAMEVSIPPVVIEMPRVDIRLDLELGPLPLGEVEPDEAVIAVDPSMVNQFHVRS